MKPEMKYFFIRPFSYVIMESIFKFRFTLLTLPERGLFSDKTTKYQLPLTFTIIDLYHYY